MHLCLMCLFHTSKGHARVLAAGVNFEREGLKRAFLHVSVPESDDERSHAMDHRSSPCQQEARPFGGAWHERLFVLVENKDHDATSSFLSLVEETP